MPQCKSSGDSTFQFRVPLAEEGKLPRLCFSLEGTAPNQPSAHLPAPQPLVLELSQSSCTRARGVALVRTAADLHNYADVDDRRSDHEVSVETRMPGQQLFFRIARLRYFPRLLQHGPLVLLGMLNAVSDTDQALALDE